MAHESGREIWKYAHHPSEPQAAIVAQVLLTYLIADRPIRIAPNMLLFPKAADAKDIYWDPALNLKAELYGTGALGPPNLFSTRDGAKHKRLRKALGGTQVSVE